jgi:signal transduction histidine kinase/response regulator of citrate/malate metabolism
MKEQTLNILVIEDENAHAEMIRCAFVRSADHFCLTLATSLGEARDRLTQGFQPDLVITDWFLPDGQGTELLSGEHDVAPFPLIVMTSYGDEKAAVDAIKAGALDYVVKSTTTLPSMPHIAERALREWRHIAERARAQKVQAALYRISEATNAAQDLDELFASVHGIVGKLMPARNFYIALYNAGTATLSFPYFVDENKEQVAPRKFDWDFTQHVLQTEEPLLVTPQTCQELLKEKGIKPVGKTTCTYWLGVPLKAHQTVGVLAVQSYTPGTKFGEEEENILTFVSTQIATAIERVQVEKKITKLNEELEHRVQARTAELQAVNEELEAFAHSVSHDLRAPLRGIHGFSQALLEDHSHQLDAQGMDYLQRVCAASQRMGQLIEDLLNMSRVTRGALRRERVDLRALACKVAAELQESHPERQVKFDIAPELVVNGDARLLRVVLDNLLGNAFKFTGERERATIKVGCTNAHGLPTYFVQDNGAGFDMTYAERLFAVFKRLHSDAEFEGTGVGLATVQRIIHRHGGRVWAESVEGEGATFYFTLCVN